MGNEIQKFDAALMDRITGALKPEVPTADMEQRLLSGLEDFKIFDIPIGVGLAAGTAALLTTEVIDAVMTTGDVNTKAVIKLLAGAGLIRFFGQFLGSGITNTAAAFLAFDAARDVIPLDQIIRDLLSGLTGGAGQEFIIGDGAAREEWTEMHSLSSAMASIH